LKVQEQHTFLG